MHSMNKLIETARGTVKAELVLKNAQVFNVFTGEFLKGDVAIVDGHIAGVGKYEGVEELDLDGKYLTPGFIDGHVHIESSMLSPSEFARAILPTGTTTIVADPHEIANVAGMKGIEYILDATENIPLSVYVMLPSCVPASNLENSGAELLAHDLEKYMQHPRVLGLGEMMNYPGVIFQDEKVIEKLKLAKHKKIDGHAPGVSGSDLMAYAAAGIKSDHECVTAEQAMDRLRAGMHVMIREGSAAKNLLNLLPAINRYTSQFCLFAADDRHPADLIAEGHVNHMVHLAARSGVDLPTVLQMATINAASYFNLEEIGAIAPNYKADILVFDDLENWKPSLVLKNGIVVAKNGKALFESKDIADKAMKATMHLAEIDKTKLRIPAPTSKARVIGLVPHQIVTKALEKEVDRVDNFFVTNIAEDILKLAVFERHNNLGNIGVGLVHGFGLKRGAIASTVAHDSHNLIVIGTNDEDILTAANALKEIQGGIAVVCDGKVLDTLALPIGGLMSDQDVHTVAEKVENLKTLAYSLGVSESYDPFLTLAFLSLPVIPELKLTDLGLVDGNAFKIVPVAVETSNL
ncbi:adenine deaminase [Anaerosinus massiliensis]|uniref:adenine deaminase n=1 Tax=Massilibacillus massiliensis TaxID=1806837 RepID=UPI000AF6F9C0|nr:adenine deaminase [Massilibacillus massiliensis]